MAPEAERSYATLIVDVVRSREAESQTAMLEALERARRSVAERIEGVQLLRPAVGDELQGVYSRPQEALKAALLLRLRLATTYDLRCGIGWGPVFGVEAKLELEVRAQSGEGWWSARAAIEEAAELVTNRGWPRILRSRASGYEASTQALLNGLLLYQDHIIAKMGQMDVDIALGLLEGKRQGEIAVALDLSQPAVSRRQLENGPACLLRAHEALEELDL